MMMMLTLKHRTAFLVLVLLSQAADLGTAVTRSDFDELTIEDNTYWLSKNTSKDMETARRMCSDISATLALFDTNAEYLLVSGYIQIYLLNNMRTLRGVFVDVISTDGAGGFAEYSWRSEPISAVLWSVSLRPDGHCRGGHREPPACCVKLYWIEAVFSNLKETSCVSSANNFLCKSNGLNEGPSTSAEMSRAIITDPTYSGEQESSVSQNATNTTITQTLKATSTDATFSWGKAASVSQMATNTNSTESLKATRTEATYSWGKATSVSQMATNTNIAEISTMESTGSRNCGTNITSCEDKSKMETTTATYPLGKATSVSQMATNTKIAEISTMESTGSRNCGTKNTSCEDKSKMETTTATYFCGQGYAPEETGSTCADIDECSENISNCSQVCVNTQGAYNCSCKPGYILGNDGHSCDDLDECSTSFHDCQSTCINTGGSYMCECLLGYTLAADNCSCVDTDECSIGSHRCSHICVNTDGSFTCKCPTGHILSNDNTTCEDMDECSISIYSCEQVCLNVDGSYICQCFGGYQLDADTGSCLDIDECSMHTQGCEQICVNTEGSHQCDCWEGYTLGQDQRSCVDVDECASAGTSCQQGCVNTAGSYVCQCRVGFQAVPNGSWCEDIDECLLDTSPCQQICINTIGSFFCSCTTGYVIGDDQTSCITSATPAQCHCSCKDPRAGNLSSGEEAKREVSRWSRELVIEKNSLSSHRRTKTSTHDDRPSTPAISAPWLLSSMAVLTVIILSDCARLLQFLNRSQQHSYSLDM